MEERKEDFCSVINDEVALAIASVAQEDGEGAYRLVSCSRGCRFNRWNPITVLVTKEPATRVSPMRMIVKASRDCVKFLTEQKKY